MIPEKYLALMNQELDGANTPAESEELESYLTANEGAARYYHELRSTLGIFERAGMVEPPADLHHQIVDKAVAQAGRGDSVRGQVVRPRFFRRLRPGYAVSFAGGALAVVLALAVFGTSFDSADRNGWRDFYATTPGLAEGDPAAVLDIDLPGLTGTVSVVAGTEGTVVHLALRGAVEAVLVTISSRRDLPCEMGRVLAPGAAGLALHGGSARIRHAGKGQYTVFFRHATSVDPDLHLEIVRQNQVLLERALVVDRP